MVVAMAAKQSDAHDDIACFLNERQIYVILRPCAFNLFTQTNVIDYGESWDYGPNVNEAEL